MEHTEHVRCYLCRKRTSKSSHGKILQRFTPNVQSSCDWATKKYIIFFLPCLILYFPMQGICTTSKIQMMEKNKLFFLKKGNSINWCQATFALLRMVIYMPESREHWCHQGHVCLRASFYMQYKWTSILLKPLWFMPLLLATEYNSWVLSCRVFLLENPDSFLNSSSEKVFYVPLCGSYVFPMTSPKSGFKDAICP